MAVHEYTTRPEDAQFSRAHSEDRVNVILALWLLGYSQSKIADQMSMGTKQIAGLVYRSPYSNRSAMSDEDRQKSYNELRKQIASTSDFPLTLPEKVNKLKSHQRMKGKAKPKADKKLSDQAGHDGREPVYRKIDRKSAVIVKTTSAPLEYMNERGMLFDRATEDNAIAMSRFDAGLKLRDLNERASVSTLMSPDMDRVGSGGQREVLSDMKLDAIKTLNRIRETCNRSTRIFGAVEPRAYWLIEQLCIQDQWVWEQCLSHKRDIRVRIVWFGLDCVRAETGGLSYQDLDRWESR